MARATKYELVVDQLDGSDPIPPELIRNAVENDLKGGGNITTMSVSLVQEGGRPPGANPDLADALETLGARVESGLSRLAKAIDSGP